MDNLDLNIDNYSLEDLLDLFKIAWDYGEDELKDYVSQKKNVEIKGMGFINEYSFI